ncbi:hypothetical protein Taro_055136 [Colocasia esculenta]|uniref:BHLH domain-containing protein n=1 Tax=Colocasia esculenta TaxID=4460 RepID=A0A843XQ88_COLES|nr:hypothetical protein [Colocasia esculenta]
MDTPENPGWLFDCPLVDELPVVGADFVNPAGGLYWQSPQGFGAPSNASVGIDGPLADSDGSKELATRKRARSETCGGPGSKACREKMRRDKLNDRFLELGSILEPGKPPKMDKAAILSDAVRAVNQLRGETQKLKESNESLQETIKELKAEKNELRDEKQRLKAEKEKLEQQIKAMSMQPSFVPPPMLPPSFPVQGQAPVNKLMMPVIGFPGFPMWQYMPPADVDTSQDAEIFPPVA